MSSKLDKLEAASFEAKKELNRLATEWAESRLLHGELGTLAACTPGQSGHDLLKAKREAAEKYRDAAMKLAEARLAENERGRAVA